MVPANKFCCRNYVSLHMLLFFMNQDVLSFDIIGKIRHSYVNSGAL